MVLEDPVMPEAHSDVCQHFAWWVKWIIGGGLVITMVWILEQQRRR